MTATTTSAAGVGLLADLGADGVVMDRLDAASVGEAVATARPEVIVHQMTGLSLTHAGQLDMKHPDRYFAGTNRLRIQGTDHLLAAAEATGVSHFVAQSNATANGIREDGLDWMKPEEDPLDPHAMPVAYAVAMEPLCHLEDVVLRSGGAALRYGWFYGPGATDDQIELIRKRKFPIIGGGTGYWSWVHLDDAASATVLAVEQKAGACSTSSTTNRPRPASGCRIWPGARAPDGRCGSPDGWAGCWPAIRR